MIEIEPKVLQERGQQLAGVLTEFQAAHPNALHDLPYTAQREYVDLFLVYLGLKPMTAPIAFLWQFDDDLLGVMAESLGGEAEKRFMIGYHQGMTFVWSPELVGQIADANADIMDSKRVKHYAGTYGFPYSVGEMDTSEYPKDRVIAGILFGFPRQAAEKAMELGGTVNYVIDILWEDTPYNERPQIGNIMFDVDGSDNRPSYGEYGGKSPRAMFLEGCERLVERGELDQASLNDLKALHPANIPGHPYATFGDITALDEGKLRSQWAMVGVEKQVQQLFGIVA